MIFINQIREYKQNHTDSDIYLDGKKYCVGLEDVGRPVGVKVLAETCIPEGIYDVEISLSNRFQKEMILLYNTADKAIVRHGVRFDGVRVHGGNDVDASEGCILANEHNDGNGKAWGRMSDYLCADIKKLIQSGETVKWVITSI